MDSLVHEDEGLWDELNHQQSREIEQHHALIMGGGRRGGSGVARDRREAADSVRVGGFSRPSSSSSPLVPVVHLRLVNRVVQQTREETSRLASLFRDAIVSSWKEHQQRQAYAAAAFGTTVPRQQLNQHQQQQQTYANGYLDEFGIPKEDEHHMMMYAATEHNNNNNHHNPNQQENEFVFLPRFGRGEGWGVAANLDIYFSSLYAYYYHRGLVPILLKGVVELVGLFFTLGLSVFLFAYVDWYALCDCIDESTCRSNFGGYLIEHPFAQRTMWNLIVILYALFFGAYGIFALWTFAHTLREATAAQWVFEERLGISSRKLQGGAIDWDRDVVVKLVELQQSGEYRIAIHGHDLDALVVAQRILRKENFLVALFNCGILDLTVPGFKGQTFFCSSLEWVIHFAVLNFMFNHKYQIRPAFYLDPSSLRRRFVVCGIAHAIFLPFLLFFLMLHFGFQHAYDWKSTKRYLGPREWSLHTRWLFREFNELPHNFEKRLAPSYKAAEDYLKLFGQSELLTAIGRILVFIGGSLGAVLFVFAAINDAILLHVKVADWNLLWYAGVVGVVYSTGKAMLPTEEEMPRNIRNLFAETDAALLNVAKHTHFYLETWKGRGSDVATYKAISSMFKYKAKLFAMEVLSVILAPYILCVSLARCAEPICEFIFAIKEEIAGAGEVCGFATFDFDKYNDEEWEGRTLGSHNNSRALRTSLVESILRTGSVEQAAMHLLKPKTRHGKMEKSFFSFKASHPSWKCSASGQKLIDRVKQYEHAETAALTREQQVHIEAAARQLETLARIEQHRQVDSSVHHALKESYIPKTHPVPLQHFLSPPSTPLPSLVVPRFDEPALHTESTASVFQPNEDVLLPFATSSMNLSPRISATMPNQFHPSASAGLHPSASAGLSTDLRRLLHMSTLDPDVSVMGSTLAGELSPGEQEERQAERQYMWLERYHAHVASQQRQLGRSADPVQAVHDHHEQPDNPSGSIA